LTLLLRSGIREFFCLVLPLPTALLFGAGRRVTLALNAAAPSAPAQPARYLQDPALHGVTTPYRTHPEAPTPSRKRDAATVHNCLSQRQLENAILFILHQALKAAPLCWPCKRCDSTATYFQGEFRTQNGENGSS
jgi:hypothetical protein